MKADEDLEDHLKVYFNTLSLTCLPTAPITPPPGCALLPHSHIPPTFPLILFENKLSRPILPWKILPYVSPIKFYKSNGVSISI